MKTVSYSELRQSLKAHLDQVCADQAPLMVTRRKGEPVVLMSLAEYEGFAFAQGACERRAFAEVIGAS
jgi:prevent-host-death family protein